MKEKILKLRLDGKTYSQIATQLNCSKSLVCYYCSEGEKEKSKERQKKLRKKNPLIKKVNFFKSRIRCKSNKFQHRKANSGDGKQFKKYDVKNITFSWKDIVKLIEKHPYCYLTGEKLDLNVANLISLDHKTPVSKGGDNSIDNLGVCIKIANCSKTNLTVNEYLSLCKKVLINFGYKVTDPSVKN